MEQFIQQVASGLANGAIYACLALALVMIFVSTDHINFAQGELAMFSAFLVWQLIEWGLNFWIALPLVCCFSFMLGVTIERVVLRPLHSAPVLSIVVVFIGLLAIFHSMAGSIWGHTIKQFASPFPKMSFAGSGFIGPHQIGMILVTLVLLFALFAFFRYTPIGLAMRAAAQNPVSARLAGIRVDLMLALGWGLAAAVGAVAGGFIVGILENLVGYFGNMLEKSTGLYIVGNGEKLMVALIIVITVLTLKPSGLFGHVTVKRV